MSGNEECQDVRELLPELALRITDGQERGRVLDHVAVCAECRRELESLSVVADELLELAPEREPPAGFELRLLGSLEPPSRRPRHTFRRPFALVAVAAAAAVVTVGVMLGVTRDDRNLASHYRSVLAEAHGSYFGAVRLHDAAGAESGVVFLYRGSPSWLVITVTQPYGRSVERAELVTTDGRKVPLTWFGLDEGTWGGAVPVDLDAISSVRLLGKGGRPLLEATVARSG
jgi:Putative zinc-finger